MSRFINIMCMNVGGEKEGQNHLQSETEGVLCKIFGGPSDLDIGAM